MQPERIESQVSARGPFVSIYIDDSPNAADAEAPLDAKWRDVRRHLADRGVDDDIIVADCADSRTTRCQRHVHLDQPATPRVAAGCTKRKQHVLQRLSAARISRPTRRR